MATVAGGRNITLLCGAAEQLQATPSTGTQSSTMTSSTTADHEMTAGHTTGEVTTNLVGSELPPTKPSACASVVPEESLPELSPTTTALTPVPFHPSPSTSLPTPVTSQSSSGPTSTAGETTSTPITHPPFGNTANQTSGIGRRSFEVTLSINSVLLASVSTSEAMPLEFFHFLYIFSHPLL